MTEVLFKDISCVLKTILSSLRSLKFVYLCLVNPVGESKDFMLAHLKRLKLIIL